jgi:uncharacterized protein YyaL (SSP411 family)
MRILKDLRLLPAACALVAYVSAASLAGELDKVAWHTDVGEAWQKSQVQQRPMLVYVTHRNCVFCVKMKQKTWTDDRVARAIREGYVPLTVDGTVPSPLMKDLAVSGYPTTFVISPQAVILERFTGYVAPEALATRLALLRSQSPPRVAQSP